MRLLDFCSFCHILLLCHAFVGNASLIKAEDGSTDSSDVKRRTRHHITSTLQLKFNFDAAAADADKDAEKQVMLDELSTVYHSTIEPVESLYQYGVLGVDSFTAAEISAKPVVLIIGPWSTGKSTIINYLLDIEDSQYALYTGAEPTTSDFTVVMHGDTYQAIDGIVLVTDHKQQFSALEKYGQSFLERLQGFEIPSVLLKQVTFVDTPGIIENRRQQERGYPFNEVMKWFINRAMLIFIVFDPFKLDVGIELENTFKQLKGRESQIRIILNKADSLEFHELMRVYGALFWNLSPLINVTEPPRVYVGSFRSVPFSGQTVHHNLFLHEEISLLQDLYVIAVSAVEMKLALVRQHAVRVLVHAELVSQYISAYNRAYSFFTDSNAVWDKILSYPHRYDVYRSILASSSVVSKYDLPPPDRYHEFFRIARPGAFRPLSSHCSYFSGCVRDHLVKTITTTLPRLLEKYRQTSGELQSCSLDESSSQCTQTTSP